MHTRQTLHKTYPYYYGHTSFTGETPQNFKGSLHTKGVGYSYISKVIFNSLKTLLT